MTKIKKTQKENLFKEQGRDLFQTPRYATEIIIPFIPNGATLWECASGQGKISTVLRENGFEVLETDIQTGFNFLTDDVSFVFDAIITNPPFSLKKKFYKKCLEYKVPFAILIPADYSGWMIDAIRFDGCEKVIPTRRIDFITPSGKSGLTGNTSNYHSLWLTHGFNIGKSETFVDLSNESKKNV